MARLLNYYYLLLFYNFKSTKVKESIQHLTNKNVKKIEIITFLTQLIDIFEIIIF